jgi:hypothetical protein
MGYDKSKRAVGQNYQRPIYQQPLALLDDEPEHEPALVSRVIVGSVTKQISERNHFSTKTRPASNNLASALRPFFS